MRRKNRQRSNTIRFVAVLMLAVFCFACGAPRHFTPSPSLSNVNALDSVKQKLPYKVALMVPRSMKEIHIKSRVLITDGCRKYKRWRVEKSYYCKGDCQLEYIDKVHLVELGNSTIEIFEEGLGKIFQEVEVIYKDKISKDDLWKYSLVVEIMDSNGYGKRESVRWSLHRYKDAPDECHPYDTGRYLADVSYKVNVYSPQKIYQKKFFINREGAAAYGGSRALLVDLPSGLLNIGTLGLFGYIYNPWRDSDTWDYANAFEEAQERAFDDFMSQFIDRKFAAFVETEKVRLAAKSNLTTSPLFADQNSTIPNNLLDAADSGNVVFNIDNSGEGIAFDVRLKIASQNSDTVITEEYTVGDVQPGQSKEVRIPIYGNLELEDGWDELYIETKEKRGYDAPPVKLKIQTARLERPELSIASVEINDGRSGQASGNGNGIPENEETVELIAFIKNNGQGPGRKVNLSLEEINSGVEVIERSQEVGTVNIGDIVKGKVVIRIPRTFSEKQLEYRLKVADARQGASEDSKEFALNLGILRPVLAYNYKLKDGGFPGTSGNSNGQVENGEKIALIITPRNNGTTEAKNVSLSIDPPSSISANRQKVNLGSLAQGKDGQPIEFLLSIPRTYDSTSLNIPLKLTQSDFEGLEERIDLPVRLIKPKLELAGFRLNGIQGHTTVGKNQEAELEIFIKNSGKLASEGLTITAVPNAQGVILKEENRTIRYGTLQPGMETEPLRFPLFIQQSAVAGELPVQVTISQNDFPGKDERLALNIQEGAVQEVIVKGEKLKSSRPYISSAANFPPKIIIDSPFEGDRLVEPEVTLRFRVSDDEEIRKVDILVNGIKHRRGIDVQGERRQFRDRKNISLVEGANTIQIIAYDNRNERAEESITVYYSKELGIGRTFAIVIGIADYEHSGIRDLSYTENDAREFKKFLMSSAGGNVPEKQIKFLAGSQATAENIMDAVGEWLPVAANRRNDRVILFFAGHGIKKRNRGYFIAYDTNPDRIVGTSVKMRDITDYLYDVEAKTVLFFSDACHSGAAFGQKLAARGDSMDGSFLINQFSGEGHITMVAAKSGQESIELPEYGHGLFTYYLLKGLKGEADKKGNGDNKVDILELYRYVYDQVTDEAKSRNFSQSPKMDSQVEGDIIMAIVP